MNYTYADHFASRNSTLVAPLICWDRIQRHSEMLEELEIISIYLSIYSVD